jgi:hypothetical protein
MSWSNRLPWRRKKKSNYPYPREHGENSGTEAIVKALHEQTTDQQNARRNSKERDGKEEQFWRDQIHEARKLNIITICGAIVALGGLAVLGGTLYFTNISMIDANRAWMAPIGLDVSTLKKGADIPFKFQYANLGKGPALDFNYILYPVRFPKGRRVSVPDVHISRNFACDNLKPSPGLAVFPVTKDTFEETYIPGKYVTQDVVSGVTDLILEGCMIYQTMGISGQTKFCFVAIKDGKGATLNHTPFCANGQDAD